MGKKKKQTVGYKYFASAHFVLCHGPIDAITKISFNDKDAYLNEENSNKTIYVNKPSLFGGDEQQGGVQGNVELLFGRSDQQKSTVLQSICARISSSFNGLISAWRGVCSVVFDNVYIGTGPNMPDSKWRVKRTQVRHDGVEQWYKEKADIIAIPEKILIDDLKFPANLATTDGSAGVTINDGFTEHDVLVVEKPKGLTYKAWSRWSSDSMIPVGRKPWENSITVTANGSSKTYWEQEFLTQNEAEEYAANLYFTLSGSDSYRFWINDIPPTDNRGGVSLRVYIGGHIDLNPAHIIRECLTNQIWGIGVNESSIDDQSFKKAADTLHYERMGISIKWTDSTSINEFVDNIKEHINAQLYLDRVTNKWKLYLIRDDYDVDDLVDLDESNIRNLDFERRTLAECVNAVTVTYWDQARAKESTVTVQDIARIAQQGGVISQSIDYKGFTNSDLASRVALRDLKTLSSTLASVSFDVDESFSESWHEGMPFKLSDESYGLSEAVMRIRTIKRGDGINNTVYVEAIEDSFSSPMQSVVEYVPPITSGDSTAKNATAIAFEVPYIELVEQYGQDEVDAKLSNYPELGYIGMAAIRPNNQHINASLYVDAGAGYDERTTLDFCPSASLKNDIVYMDSSFELESVAEFELLQVNHRIQVNDEIMAFVSFDAVTNVITVKRGCFDTLPQKHSAGSKIFGWDNYSGIDDLEYLSGENLSLKAVTLTGSDVLELNEATSHSLTLSGRAIRPYPPANVKINDVHWPDDVTGDLILTWNHRNRVQQTGGSPLGWFDSDVILEDGVTYVVELYDETGLLISSTNIGAVNTTTVDYSSVTTATCRIKLYSIRDGYKSQQAFEHTVIISFNPPYNLQGNWDVENQAVNLSWSFDA